MENLCTICNRDHKRMNGEFSECSHVDCPHRRRAWSDGTGAETRTLKKPICRDPKPLTGDLEKDRD